MLPLTIKSVCLSVCHILEPKLDAVSPRKEISIFTSFKDLWLVVPTLRAIEANAADGILLIRYAAGWATSLLPWLLCKVRVKIFMLICCQPIVLAVMSWAWKVIPFSKVSHPSKSNYFRVRLLTSSVCVFQLQYYSEKFEDFQSTLEKSNEVFTSFRTEMDKMSKKLKQAEKYRATMQKKWEDSTKALANTVDYVSNTYSIYMLCLESQTNSVSLTNC